jgi:hypothetical protein
MVEVKHNEWLWCYVTIVMLMNFETNFKYSFVHVFFNLVYFSFIFVLTIYSLEHYIITWGGGGQTNCEGISLQCVQVGPPTRQEDFWVTSQSSGGLPCQTHLPQQSQYCDISSAHIKFTSKARATNTQQVLPVKVANYSQLLVCEA